MKLRRLAIADMVEITPERHSDDRGYFSETFREDWFADQVADIRFVQENQSLSRTAGVVRGLHFQSDPSAQGKLVRCVLGAIFDVGVDVRQGSPEFGNWAAVTLTADLGNQLWIPPGFLHGFCTLTSNTVVSYKVTNYYDRASDKGVRWNDPEIGIVWPELADPSTLSSKDAEQPFLSELEAHFQYPCARV